MKAQLAEAPASGSLMKLPPRCQPGLTWKPAGMDPRAHSHGCCQAWVPCRQLDEGSVPCWLSTLAAIRSSLPHGILPPGAYHVAACSSKPVRRASIETPIRWTLEPYSQFTKVTSSHHRHIPLVRHQSQVHPHLRGVDPKGVSTRRPSRISLPQRGSFVWSLISSELFYFGGIYKAG